MTTVAAGLSVTKSDVGQEQQSKKNPGPQCLCKAIQGIRHRISCAALVWIGNRSSLGIQVEPVSVRSIFAEVEHVV
jgi:hypothetical protein